jgi:serine protease Do
VAKARPAVVKLDVGGGHGTAFLIDGKGHIVTNRHVVVAGSKFQARTAGGRTLTAKLVGTSKRHDIAVLRIRGLKASPLAWGTAPKISQRALVLGYPAGPVDGDPFSAAQGIVSGLGRDISEPGELPDPDMAQYDISTNPGNSGGPVLGSDGQVVAVHTMGAPDRQGMNYGVLAKKARDVVKRLLS